MELSILGLGTYLGQPDEATDAAYTASAKAFFQARGNVFDSAANYRMGRSERALGLAFQAMPRSDYFVSTKAGYLPMGDGTTRETPGAWFQRVLARPGILSLGEVVDGCHALTPRYLAHQLDLSLGALGLERLDLFHLHNPEQQRPSLGPKVFRSLMRMAFEACEGFVRDGRIDSYGCATWNGFRVPPDAPEHLSLEELLEVAREVGGYEHHFQWIQAPLNLAMPEALLLPTQRMEGHEMPLLEAATRSGIHVQSSASILQARILGGLAPENVKAMGCRTPAQAALQFTRSCPGVTVTLCGMSRVEHVLENAEVMAMPPLEASELSRLCV